MKKVFAMVIVVMLLAAMIPAALAAPTVYVSVSVDGKLELAAQPVAITDLTVNGAIKAAHKAYYSGGEAGYAAGVDKTWNMFMITKCWGVAATPYVIVNDYPVGSKKSPATADVAEVKDGDNIVIAVSSDMAKPATAVALKASVSDGIATVTATSWILDFTTFTYNTAPFSGAAVVDISGASLGSTDTDGSIKAAVPADGIVAIKGLSAINVNASSTTTAAPADSAAAASAPAGEGTMVYFSISVDGELLVAAEPVYVTDLTVEAVIKAAHAAFYAGGESGFSGSVDKTYNMYMITKCWGVMTVPYVVVNDAPLGSNGGAVSADAAAVKQGDNIIIALSSDYMTPTETVAITIGSLDNGAATITATSWTLDFETFTYDAAPLFGATVIDPATGETLGSTDNNGTITVTIPASGIVAVDGLAAIRVDGSAAEPTPATGGFGGGFGGTTTGGFGGTTGGFGGGFGNFGSMAAPVDNKPIVKGVLGVVVLVPVAAAIIIAVVKQVRKNKQRNPGNYPGSF